MADAGKGDAQDELNEFYNFHFLVLTVRNFQKSTLWLDVATAFCAMRAANTFTVACAWIGFVLRVVQLAGVAIRKERVS